MINNVIALFRGKKNMDGFQTIMLLAKVSSFNGGQEGQTYKN